MNKEAKTALIEELAEKFQETKFFYVTDFSSLTVAQTNDFRRKCYEHNVEMRVVKNTLVRKALERVSDTAYEGLYQDLKGPSAILFAETGKVPAVVLKEFRGKDGEKPALKAAYIGEDIIRGDNQLEFLANLKSKEDLIGEVISLLQSPMKNLVSVLKGPEQNLMALLKGIEEK